MTGNAISPGLAKGLIHIHHILPGPIDIPERLTRDSVENELSRLDVATASISEDLLLLAAHVERQIDSRLAEVFDAHQLMVNDSVLREELQKEITQNLMTATNAVKTVFLRWEKRFLLMESQLSRDKSDDMHDISKRLLNALAGITIHPLDKVPNNCVLAISRLLPSDTIFLSEKSIAAVLLEYGSSGSHAALFTREMGLPTIAGLDNLFANISESSLALVDADYGKVIICPSAGQEKEFVGRIKRKEKRHKVALLDTQWPAVTKDGVAISVLANVGSIADVEKAMLNGAEGIGLYRIEHAYLGCVLPPGVEDLVNEIGGILKAARGSPVCVRLLDIGADKPLPFLGFLAESNPALGRRGIRLLLEYPELLKTQLLAILELSRDFDIRILIPMVTLAVDVLEVKTLLNQLVKKLDLKHSPKLGAMIETPAAALSASEFSKHVDFFSFGTNDLTQYAFAADRDNSAVDKYFDDTSDVIFRLLRLVHEDAFGMRLAVCGELAGRPEYIQRILQCGVRTLSVIPPLIPYIKQAVREAVCLMPERKR